MIRTQNENAASAAFQKSTAEAVLFLFGCRCCQTFGCCQCQTFNCRCCQTFGCRQCQTFNCRQCQTFSCRRCQTFNCRRMSGGFALFHKRPDISAHSDCSKQPHSENVGDEVFPKLRIPKQLGHYGHAFEDC